MTSSVFEPLEKKIITLTEKVFTCKTDSPSNLFVPFVRYNPLGLSACSRLLLEDTTFCRVAFVDIAVAAVVVVVCTTGR